MDAESTMGSRVVRTLEGSLAIVTPKTPMGAVAFQDEGLPHRPTLPTSSSCCVDLWAHTRARVEQRQLPRPLLALSPAIAFCGPQRGSSPRSQLTRSPTVEVPGGPHSTLSP